MTEQNTPAGPHLTYGLNEGERIMIRRALALYAQHFTEQLRQHKVAGDAYNSEYDQQRLTAINELSDKILKGGRK